MHINEDKNIPRACMHINSVYERLIRSARNHLGVRGEWIWYWEFLIFLRQAWKMRKNSLSWRCGVQQRRRGKLDQPTESHHQTQCCCGGLVAIIFISHPSSASFSLAVVITTVSMDDFLSYGRSYEERGEISLRFMSVYHRVKVERESDF